MTKPLTLLGNRQSPGSVVINAASARLHFRVENVQGTVRLAGLELTRGHDTEAGSVRAFQTDAFILCKCWFQANDGPGGVSLESCGVDTVTVCNFARNTSSTIVQVGGGAALY